MTFSPTALPVDRRTWVNEQIAHPLTRLDKVPLHAFAAAGQYSDSIAGLGSLNYDSGPFELHAYAGRRSAEPQRQPCEARSDGVALPPRRRDEVKYSRTPPSGSGTSVGSNGKRMPSGSPVS